MIAGLKLIRGGKYKCKYCDHPGYKIYQAAEDHVKNRHELEMLKQEKMNLEVQLLEERARPPKIQIKEKVVYREKAEPENKWADQYVDVYCKNENIVYTHVRMPRGVLKENVSCHSCGTCSLIVINKII